MAVPVDKNKKKLQYFMVPNVFWDSKFYDIYDKAVFCCLIRPGVKSFQSIKRISETLSIARPTVIKSLKKLERHNAIRRFKMGKKIYYESHFEENPYHPDGAILIKYPCNR